MAAAEAQEPLCSGPEGPREASVIIPTYNGLRYLGDCLRSVFHEVGSGDEVVVVDNASGDGSPDFVAGHYPDAILVRNAENRGFAAACNQGARLACGQILVFLNQDTRVEPGWLEALVRGLDEQTAVGLTTSRLLLMAHPNRIHLCGQDVHYTGLVFGRGYGEPADTFDVDGDVNAVSGASFAIGRQLWEALGGFDEALYMYYEETDLSWRAQLAGYRCRYVSASQAYHDYSPTQPSFSRLFYSFRNRIIMLLKNWQWVTLLLLLPALCLAELIEVSLAMMQGWRGMRAKLLAQAWIVTHGRELCRMRARAQAVRQVPDLAILGTLACKVRPKREMLGMIPSIAIKASNGVFWLNYQVALWLLRRRSATPVRPHEVGDQ